MVLLKFQDLHLESKKGRHKQSFGIYIRLPRLLHVNLLPTKLNKFKFEVDIT